MFKYVIFKHHKKWCENSQKIIWGELSTLYFLEQLLTSAGRYKG